MIEKRTMKHICLTIVPTTVLILSNMVKVEWICILPCCKSNSRASDHFFPKNVTLAWKEAINNDIISNVLPED